MKVKHLLGILAITAVLIGVVAFFSFRPAATTTVSSKTTGIQLLYEIGKDDPEHLLREPVYAVADQQGNVFVADAGSHSIKVFSRDGEFSYEFAGPGSQKSLSYPYGMGIVGKSRLIVADSGAGTLEEFTLEGEHVKTWLNSAAKVRPAYVFVTADSNVYVTDLIGNQILVFSANGIVQRKIRSLRIDLSSPQGIAVNKDGSVWVADGGNYNVKLIKPNGEVKLVFDGGPKWALTTAKGLAVDKQERIYVADPLSKVVRVFDRNGNDQAGFGLVDTNRSQIQMPVGLSIDNNGKIFVADQGAGVIQVWGWK